MLINGEWREAWQPVQSTDEAGRFIRRAAGFRHQVEATVTGEPAPRFAAEAGRYHLYVALICPWASRTLMARAIKGLESVVSVSVVSPILGDQGWSFGEFPGAAPDPIGDAEYMHEIYTATDPTYTGRATVPVLYDRRHGCIVNNESADIVRMFNSAFDEFTAGTPDLYPAHLRHEIDALNSELYERLNNGVYRAGFATTQFAYEEAEADVAGMLAQMETRLGDGRQYLFGDTLTESDIRLFVTLVRFDEAYYGLFKCNRTLIAQQPALSAYMARIEALPGVAQTVNRAHIRAGYYSIQALNPNGIVPVGPAAA